jgi:hypothetical protein
MVPCAFLVTWANGERSLKFPETFGPGLRAGARARGATVTPLGAVEYNEPAFKPHRIEGLQSDYDWYRHPSTATVADGATVGVV